VRLLLSRLRSLPSPTSQTVRDFRKKADDKWRTLRDGLGDPAILHRGYFAFLPVAFFCFVATLLFALPLRSVLPCGTLLLFLVLSFSAGLLFLTAGIILHLRSLSVFRLLFPPEGRATLRIHEVNGQPYTGARLALPSATNYVDVDVSFEGSVTNGFIDTRVIFDTGEYLYYPDPDSYLSPFTYRGRTLVLNPIYDTGLIQGKWDNTDTCRTLRFYVKKDPASPYPFLGQTVAKLEVGLYEDPLFYPSFEPRGGLAEKPERIRLQVDAKTISFV